MDPTVQWEDASNIMNTKANCAAILCRAESSGPQGQYEVLLAVAEKEASFLSQPRIRFTGGGLSPGAQSVRFTSTLVICRVK